MRNEPVGPLHGVPVAIKDITPTAGIRTTYGSPLYRENIPAEDAEVVRRLKTAGAIVIGKTNTPEFACGAYTHNAVFGATLNPWNPRLSPAGSSGGSAVAVATGMVPIAQATDFGGSIRVPAAFCGIVGIRPTPGLVPSYPMPLAWDPGQTNGPLARNAEDAALMLDAMVGFSRLSPISVAPPWQSALAEVERRTGAKGLRIAYAPDIAGIGVDAEVEALCRKAALRLRDAGAIVEEIDFSASDGRAPYQVWRGLWMVGQQYQRLSELEQFGEALQGQRTRWTEDDGARFCRGRAEAAGGVPSLPDAVRALRCPAHSRGAGKALSAWKKIFPNRSTAKSSRIISTGSRRRSWSRSSAYPPQALPRACTSDGLPSRNPNRGAALRGANDLKSREPHSQAKWSGMAAMYHSHPIVGTR